MKSQAELPQKELTIAERVVVLRKIRKQPPNISHRQLAEITGVTRTPWHRYCKTSDNRVSRLIGPNGAYPDVTRLSGIYCISIVSVTCCFCSAIIILFVNLELSRVQTL